MSDETSYRVRSSAGERDYLLYELTWLWRTAELPHDAEFRDPTGAWRSVRELVDPILEREQQTLREREKVEVEAATRDGPHTGSRRWRWLATGAGGLLAVLLIGPGLSERYGAWRNAKARERAALEAEQAARMEDFVASNLVVPGMVPAQVRRTIGPPRSIKATGDGSVERWIYRKQVVVFEQGKVVGVEALPPEENKRSNQ